MRHLVQALAQAGDVAAVVVVGHPVVALVAPDHGRIDLQRDGVGRAVEVVESVRAQVAAAADEVAAQVRPRVFRGLAVCERLAVQAVARPAIRQEQRGEALDVYC